ncbi:MAG: YraN family protein [Patescibacteria group bacterium]
MGGYRFDLGRLGENLAEKFLKRRNYEIIARNFSTNYGELDLIARLGGEILFCEVKTRSGQSFGYPEYAVDRQKISHLLKAINIYLNRYKVESFWRLDTISVEINKENKTAHLRWFKDVGRD